MKHFPTVLCVILVAVLFYTVSTEESRHGNKLIGVTAQCKDGKFTSAKKSQGACSGHGGVKYWIEQGPKDE